MATNGPLIRLQLAGLTDPNADHRVGRALQAGTWSVPEVIALDAPSGSLRWDGDGRAKGVTAPPDFLDRFMRLRSANDTVIHQFAREYGVVQLCAEHTWAPLGHYFPYDEPSSSDDFCTVQIPLGGTADPYVPTSWYRWFSAWCCEVLNLIMRLQDGKPGELESWQVVSPTFAEHHGFQLTWRSGLVRQARSDIVRDDKQELERVLNTWLFMNRLRLHVEWSDAPHVELTPGTLVGQLLVNLVFALSHSGGFAFCSNCGNPFSPTRKPTEGRRRYCNDCKHASIRDAKRDSRARRRFAQ